MTEEVLGEAVAKLDPEYVSPVVAWLAHEDVPVTGEVFSVGGGRVARFFIGMTHGYYNAHLTVEDVRDHFAEIQRRIRIHRSRRAGRRVRRGVQDDGRGVSPPNLLFEQAASVAQGPSLAVPDHHPDLLGPAMEGQPAGARRRR